MATAERRRLTVACLSLGGAAQVLPQLTALLAMQPGSFGRFSILDLLFAWGVSLQLSLVCEPWARTRTGDGRDAEERGYRRAASTLGLAMGIVGALAALLLWRSPGLVAAALVAVAGAVFRAAARYREISTCGLLAAGRGDLGFGVAFGVAFLALDRVCSATLAVTTAWAAAALTAMVVGVHPAAPGLAIARAWVAEHRTHIKPLLAESLLLDLSSIGTPFVLAPFLGLRDFGIYRAMSNVAAPVRVLTDALRPLASRASEPSVRRTLLLGSTTAGVLVAVAADVGIRLVARSDLDLGVVNALEPYAEETAVFVGASLVGALFYFVARVHAPPRRLWQGRLLQSGSALVLPVASCLLAGLNGAIVSSAAATALGAAVWVYFALVPAES
jgi:hypothetical protein